jgi:hypothetical protein
MSFQVGAGGERVTGSIDDSDAKLWGVTEVAADIAEKLVGFDVDGVLDFWAGEGDVGNLTALVVEDFRRHRKPFRDN